MIHKIKKRTIALISGTIVAAVALIFMYFSFSSVSTTRLPEEAISDNRSSPGQTDVKITNNDKSNSTQSAPTETGHATPKLHEQNALISSDNSSFQVESGATFPLRTYKTLAVNDPNGNQWWTNSTGLESAWNIGSGPKQTTVAVIDTGFALQHEEFTNRWAYNEGEQGPTENEAPSILNCTDRGIPLDKSCNLIDDNFDGIVDNETGPTTRENPSRLNCTDRGIPLDKSCNLIDDDGSGFVDDVIGWDFANFDNSVQAGETNPDGNGVRHGTAVTGVLAANGNNNKGIAGVDWNTKILPIQALNDDSYGNTLTVGRAIYYAADRGVDVINLSIGSDAEDPYLRQAIHYALDKNIIVVAASGNDGCNCMVYPARYPEVVAVGAQSQSGNPATFSSYGAELNLLAPGEDMTTPIWSKTLPETGYATNMAGTSFAAPYVSGLLSLSRSHQPTAQWGELVNGLLSTADHGSLSAADPFSIHLGSGYAQANTFLTRLTTPNQPGMRYIFSPTPLNSTLSSSLSYQCMGSSDFPTAPLYEISSGTSTFYTIDELERVRATNRGDTVKYVARTCVGLPTDRPSTVRRINLLREIKNIYTSKE